MANLTYKTRHVGNVANGVFTKTVRGSKHFLRKPPAIAFSARTLCEARQHGAHTIVVTDSETGNRYTAPLKDVIENGRSIERGGFEQQIYWPMENWKTA